MKTWIYSWIIYPLVYCIALAFGLFKPKVRRTLKLRAWKDYLSLRFNAGAPIEYWIHVASAGELEYAVPVIEELQRRGKQVLITYYSISAKDSVERLRERYTNVSLVVPLPHDGLGLMKEFVRLVRAQGVKVLLLMKYELWPGMLWECRAEGVRILLIDALKPGWFHRQLIHKLDAIIAGYRGEIDDVTHPELHVMGDTRVERVVSRMQNASGVVANTLNAELISRLNSGTTIVFGSMWPEDDQKILISNLSQLRKDGINLVWVPHEIEVDYATKILDRFKEAGFESIGIGLEQSADGQTIGAQKIPNVPLAVVIAKKGMLTELYRLGKAAYVGGGFGDGIHSVWEPALAGVIVACGPKRERSPESEELLQGGILTPLTTSEDALRWFAEINGRIQRGTQTVKDSLQSISERHLGAAHRIIEFAEAKYGKYKSESRHPVTTQ